MKAEIINIGDEILIGQIINTNAQWIAQQLNLQGVQVSKMTTIPDKENDIIESLTASLAYSEIIIITGGLGPTKDDITKQTLAKFFGADLVLNPDVKKGLEEWFKKRGKTLNEGNLSQCWVPSNCQVLMNHWGTAPGMRFEYQNRIIYSLPGVPTEMQNLMQSYILPEISSSFDLPPILHKSFNIEGIPETELMKAIEHWESNLPKEIKLAYLPSAGLVKLRLSTPNADGNGESRIKSESAKLYDLIGNDIYGEDEETLEKIIKELLLLKKATITTAESCTGGYLAHKLTSVPGISSCFPGSIITYDYWVKTEILGVDDSILKKQGAVSSEVVEQMALHARKIMKTDYAISVSGIAGPDGGTNDKPVGTTWIGWATPNEVLSKKFIFPGDRMGNIHRSYLKALSILRKLILGIPIEKGYWEE